MYIGEEGNIFYISDFDDSMERDLIIPITKEIQRQKAYKDGQIDLYINSFGGFSHIVFHLISLLELAKREGIVVRTIVSSVAYSCGSALSVVGTPGERYIDKNGELLIHYGTTYHKIETPEQLDRTHTSNKNHFNKILNHYKRYSTCSTSELKDLMKDNNGYITAKRAIKWGMADKYMDKFDIGESL